MIRAGLVVVLALLICPYPAIATEPKPDQPVIVVVTTSYDGANCQVVADTIAAPIEQQINGAQGLRRIESQSRNDGSYSARLTFKSTIDAKRAVEVTKKRVALAEPVLPDPVRRNGISVTTGNSEMTEGKVTIALINRGEYGVQAMRELSAAVMKRLTAETALTKPVMFPLDEEQPVMRLDRERCVRLAVIADDVYKLMGSVKPGMNIDDLKQLRVKSMTGRAIPVGSLAAFELVRRPAAVFRVNLYPAIRIRGGVPKGASAAESATKCVKLAEDELKRAAQPLQITVEPLR